MMCWEAKIAGPMWIKQKVCQCLYDRLSTYLLAFCWEFDYLDERLMLDVIVQQHVRNVMREKHTIDNFKSDLPTSP